MEQPTVGASETVTLSDPNVGGLIPPSEKASVRF